ncbi:MAG TPA: energy-coupling factor transporter transmembrane protein EcfT, partial [Candidatus Mediterraneibacter norfolkensis]|nr:energy-coupling factor transporter transmembrane protein EcfT [Candidatus Mediterraneibacter norfolkensis]
MIHTRDRSSLLKKLNPRSKLWLTLGLILSNVLFKNYYYSILLMIISIIMIVKEKQLTLFKVILVSMTVLFIS